MSLSRLPAGEVDVSNIDQNRHEDGLEYIRTFEISPSRRELESFARVQHSLA